MTQPSQSTQPPLRAADRRDHLPTPRTAYLGITILRDKNPDKTGARPDGGSGQLMILKGRCERC
jgi:hypothetical protein